MCFYYETLHFLLYFNPWINRLSLLFSSPSFPPPLLLSLSLFPLWRTNEVFHSQTVLPTLLLRTRQLASLFLYLSFSAFASARSSHRRNGSSLVRESRWWLLLQAYTSPFLSPYQNTRIPELGVWFSLRRGERCTREEVGESTSSTFPLLPSTLLITT